jgi:hypothetical protein
MPRGHHRKARAVARRLGLPRGCQHGMEDSAGGGPVPRRTGPTRARDAKFTAAFDTVFTAAGIELIRTPPQALSTNAFAALPLIRISSSAQVRRSVVGDLLYLALGRG